MLYQEISFAVLAHCHQTGFTEPEMQAAFCAAACNYVSQGNSVKEALRKCFTAQPQTAANSEPVSRTAQRLGSEALQAMSPTPATAPPTPEDKLQQQLHTTAVLSWQEHLSLSSSSKIQELRRVLEFAWRKLEEAKTEQADNHRLDAMMAQTHNLLMEEEEDNSLDFRLCLHKAMPAEGNRVFGNA